MRSTQLDRDFADPSALDDYCLTSFGLECLASVSEGFGKKSGRRAWRFTGDYGTGKSSFALLLARFAQSVTGGVPKQLNETVLKRAPELKKRNFIPLLVVGARESMNQAITRQLFAAVNERFGKNLPASLKKRFAATTTKPLSDTELIEILESVNSHGIETGKSEGILLIIDEAGKFLEYSAMQPEGQDVMLFQKLAEASTRSGGNPLLVVCLFHIAFSEYAVHLSPTVQREWNKVAGRFEEISFTQPLDQVATLIASALRVDVDRLPKAFLKSGLEVMDKAREWRWFGSGSASQAWRALTAEIFPIDPLLLPVAMRVFHQFAQNERSLFNFLFSYEPFGLRAYAAQCLEAADWLRLPKFFDYVRANLGQRLSQASYRSRWPVIEAVLEASADLPEIERDTLKTIAILNLIGAEDLRPTQEAICWAAAGANGEQRKEVARALTKLTKSSRVFFRGEARGYCLWSYSSVDLDKAYEDAKKSVPEISSIGEALQKHLICRPLVARRHYIESGNLRHFDVDYIPVALMEEQLRTCQTTRSGDGNVIIVLCEDEVERTKALKIAAREDLADEMALVAVTQPLRHLRGYVIDAQRWEWVASNTKELNTDRYAREEVQRQVAHAQNLLASQLANYVGLERASGANTLRWFLSGKPQTHIKRGGDLLRELSEICARVFNASSPRLNNELLNREAVSSAAAGARIRLIEHLLIHSDAARLAIPAGKHPPELSMYLSVLQKTGLHREVDGVWRICIPTTEEEDPQNLRHCLNFIKDSLEKSPDARVSVSSIYDHLTKKPYGVRKGLLPLLLAIVYVTHAHEIAVYERGNFVPDVNGDAFLRITKVPEIFEFQWVRIHGLRSEVLEELRQTLALPAPTARKTRLLEIVTALCNFAARLPEYSRKTRSLSANALSVREVLLSAREPVKLLLYRLPEACGVPSFPPTDQSPLVSAQTFVRRLHECLRELQGAYDTLLSRLQSRLELHFRVTGNNLHEVREEISSRAARLQKHIREPRLVAFCSQLTDSGQKGVGWIAALASTLARKPAAYWVDADEAKFDTELADLCGLFLRVENLHIGDLHTTGTGRAFRVAVTHADGAEIAEVIHIKKKDDQRLAAIQQSFATIFDREGTLAVAAAAQELDRLLRKTQP